MDTACSSSLVALNTAMNDLRLGINHTHYVLLNDELIHS